MARKAFTTITLLVLMLTACQAGTATPAVTPGVVTMAPTSPTVSATPAASATPALRTLNICLGEEPRSLYLYGASARGQWSVLEAIYDGPFDTHNYTPQPVIMENLPAVGGADAPLTPVEVKQGDLVVDANGDIKALDTGVKVLPSGCAGGECSSTWDGKKALKMDQLKVTFRLKSGIKWSDGTALTADDSVYSFELASNPATPVSRRVVDRTLGYRAVNDQSVEWLGLPGYVPARLDSLFFTPLPRHAWGKYKPADLLTLDDSNKKPVGWGPYMIDEWKPGQSIQLKKNPLYFRAAEGLPKFDFLVLRFLSDQGDANLQAVLQGRCDVVDSTALLDDQLKTMIQLSNDNKVKLWLGQGPEWEHLDFGIRPAAYDDGFDAAKDRPDFFGDVRVRKAFADCIDRQGIIQQFLYNRSSVPGGYTPPNSPLFQQALTPLAYDPAAGAKLLDEAGWKDADNNPDTPRISQGLPGAPKGTPFSIIYNTTDSPLRKNIAIAIQKNLAACGIQMKINPLPAGDLFGPGPDGLVFGRRFDLVQFAWESGSLPACNLYESTQAPTSKNNWTGANITGLNSARLDTACQKARQARPGTPAFTSAAQEAERIFAEELPVIPLYFRLKIAVSRPDLCGVMLDPSSRSLLSGVESLDIGAGCK